MRPLLTVLITAVAALSATAGVASADAPYEPNDTGAQAYGPLAGDAEYVTTIETEGDQDWFFLNTTGQRQVGLDLTDLDGCATGAVTVYDLDGKTAAADALTPTTPGGAAHAPFTSPAASRFTVRVTGEAGCAYALEVSPADALTPQSPGLVATLHAPHYAVPDDEQRLLVDGQLAGKVVGITNGIVSLGHPAGTSRVTFEAENFDGGWGWDVRILDVEGRDTTTVFADSGSGRAPLRGPVRRGVVRRAVLTPAGTVLESCGETIPGAPCFPFDQDLDGVPDGSDRCMSVAGPASTAGCPDADGDKVIDAEDHCPGVAGTAGAGGCPDADGDGVDDSHDACDTLRGPLPVGCPPQRNYVTTVSLHRHGRKFTGKVLSAGPGCVAGREVLLRRSHDRTIYGRAKARSDGRFRIVATGAKRGPFYVAVSGRRATRKLCRAATSRTVR